MELIYNNITSNIKKIAIINKQICDFFQIYDFFVFVY